MEKYTKILLALLIMLTGCTKGFLDINTDPNNPSKASLGLLLTHVEKDVADNLSVNQGLGAITTIYMQQYSTRENPDGYGITGGSSYASTPWDYFYTGLSSGSGAYDQPGRSRSECNLFWYC